MMYNRGNHHRKNAYANEEQEICNYNIHHKLASFYNAMHYLPVSAWCANKNNPMDTFVFQQ